MLQAVNRRRQGSLRRALFALAVLAAIAYLGAIAWLMLNETRLVFQPARALGPLRPAAPFEQVDLVHPDGSRALAWISRHAAGADGKPWVLYLHGNAASIAHRWNVLRSEQLRGLGTNVLSVEYRGYAGLPGTPSESMVTADARAGYDYLRARLKAEPAQIVVYGWSLGSAVAVNLASQVPTGGVILEGAMASVAGIGEQAYPIFPVRWMMRNRFDSIDRIAGITAPLLFLHSPEDDIVPIADARRLYDAARAPKTFVEVRGGHIDPATVDRQHFFDAIRAFLRTLNQNLEP